MRLFWQFSHISLTKLYHYFTFIFEGHFFVALILGQGLYFRRWAFLVLGLDAWSVDEVWASSLRSSWARPPTFPSLSPVVVAQPCSPCFLGSLAYSCMEYEQLCSTPRLTGTFEDPLCTAFSFCPTPLIPASYSPHLWSLPPQHTRQLWSAWAVAHYARVRKISSSRERGIHETRLTNFPSWGSPSCAACCPVSRSSCLTFVLSNFMVKAGRPGTSHSVTAWSGCLLLVSVNFISIQQTWKWGVKEGRDYQLRTKS